MDLFELIHCDNCGKSFAVLQKEIEKDVLASIQQNIKHPEIKTSGEVVHLSDSHLTCPYCWYTETLFKLGESFTVDTEGC